ncbi:MAG: hypothetical protein R3C03_18535 [Pirellulaceae bacterium]
MLSKNILCPRLTDKPFQRLTRIASQMLRYAFPILVAIICMLKTTQWSNAQEQHIRYLFFLQPSGEVKKIIHGLGEADDHSIVIDHLTTESTAEELDLTLAQEAELKAATEEFRHRVKKLKEGYENQLDTNTKLIQELADAAQDFDRKAGQILLPDQTERFYQLVIHRNIRKQGLGAVLESSPRCDPLQITDLQLTELKKRLASIKFESNAKFDELRIKLFDDVITCIQQKKRERYDKRFWDSLKNNPTPLEFRYSQIRDSKFFQNYLSSSEFNFPGLMCPKSFVVDLDGNLNWDEQQSTFKHGKSVTLQMEISAMLSPEIAEEVELLDDQIALLKELQEKRSEIQRVAVEMIKNAPPGVSQSDATQPANEMVKQWVLNAEETLKTLLLPTQREQLQLMSEYSEFVIAGPIASLSDGDLGKRLEVTDDELKKVVDVCNRFQQTFEKQLRDTEKKVFDNVRELLDETQRESFDRIIGPPPAHSIGWLSSLFDMVEDEQAVQLKTGG